MKSNTASLGAIALALGTVAVLGAGDGADRVVSQSAKAAKKAASALGDRRTGAAIAAAEQAVALSPRAAAYRLLLGQSYLQAGRFRSAGEAFADTLELDGGNAKAALNLALTQVAAGDWQAARHTLAVSANAIPASDRGLALALAGDTAGAVALLTQVARSSESTPKARQNLALAYALGGQWGVARVIASADMSPADVDARLQQWAAFAQPREASDQVASLLGVRPVADAGQPAALALNAAAPAVAPSVVAPAALAKIEPAPAPVPAVARAEPTPASVVTTKPAPVSAAQPKVAALGPSISPVVFASARPVVQPLPAAPSLLVTTAAHATAPAAASVLTIERTPGGYKMALKAPVRQPAKVVASGGSWHVQLGAFENAGVAKDAWGRATRRFAAFKGHAPQGMAFRTAKASFYRLSVGGFARADADRACRQYRARGGVCFVRMSAGDQGASWIRPTSVQTARAAKTRGVQLAMR